MQDSTTRIVGLAASVALLVALLSAVAAPAAAQVDPASCGGLPATIVGTDGDDDLTGTDGPDVIAGLGGKDKIEGGGGDDVICGDEGDDKIEGGDGDDVIEGGSGKDHLEGNDGDDRISGGDGDDKIDGNAGNDILLGGPGKDDLDGHEGNDEISGGDDDDKIDTGDGDDAAEGGDGEDDLKGKDGDDVLDGGAGDDKIHGDKGNDVLAGGAGEDDIKGHQGDDRITGGDDDDRIDAGEGDDRVSAGGGDDDVKGKKGDDVLDGGPGFDKIDGAQGFDACRGEDVEKCESDVIGPQEIALIPYPDDPEPLTFPVNTTVFEGVELTIETDGGLYPWDVAVQPAYTRARMSEIIVSELIDISLADGAPDFRSATLTLRYDPALVADVPESALRIWTYDEDLQFWLPVPGQQVVDTDAHTVTATLDHFSIYAVLEADQAQPELWRRVTGDTPVFCVADDASLGVDVVFAIDTSGSMNSNDPGDLRVAAARAFVQEMRETDKAGVVGFSSGASTRIGLTLLDSPANVAAVNSAIDSTGAAGGGTNISAALSTSTALLSGSEVGRPRITLLLTDGVGTYSTENAQAADAANVTVYTVGLGSGVNAAILSEIADITGGEYIQLETADQLVPLYEELGGTIFDDGTDTDLDTITDCVETNGAFVPSVVFAASIFPFPSRLDDLFEPRPAYITLNPNDADTDGDDVDDGVELTEADMRANLLLALEYGFLIDSGITRYYIENSDPLDEFDPGVDVPGDLNFLFESGLLSVDGLNIDDTTLFQPDRYSEQPVIEGRLLGDRTDTGIRVRRVDYDANPVVYAGNELCVENCTEIERLANERNSDNGWWSPGCSLLGDDFECEVKQIISEARGDQNIFEGDDDLSRYFVSEQVALRCAIAIGQLDNCVRGGFNTRFTNIQPAELDLITTSLTNDDARWLFYKPLLNEIGVPFNFDTEIFGGDMTTFVNFRENIITLWDQFDYVDTATGPADGFVLEDDFYDVIPGLAGTEADLRAAIAWFDDNRLRLEREHNRLFQDQVAFDVVRSAVIFSEAFDLDPGGVPTLLEQFPLVGKGGEGIELSRFVNFEPSLQRMFDVAIAFVNPADRVRQNEYVSRLPETWAGNRNRLITAVYIEYGQEIQDWLGVGKGGNWGLVAPWASDGVNGAVRGEFPVILSGPQQAAADGNQWIFRNIGSRYAAFVEVISADPTPSEAAWEAFFGPANFGPGDATLRDGFVALVAAKAEPDVDRAQELLFQSNVLLATHEQEGVHLHLQKFDVLPTDVENWFIDLQMGADLELSVNDDLYSNLGIDPNGPAPAGNRVWPTNLLTLDPTGEDASVFSAPGFQVVEGASPSSGVVDVTATSGIESTGFAIAWDDWRDANTSAGEPNIYAGTSARPWWDWEERMWYLTNLFRSLHTDPGIAVPPAGRGLSSLSGEYRAATLGKLDIG